MKRQYREEQDAWDGFGAGEYVYSEKAEKKYESAVWKYLAIGAVALFLFVVFMHVKELKVVLGGKSFVAEYQEETNGAEIVTYIDEGGKYHFFDVTGLNAVHSEEEITMYYGDNIDDAIPKTGWESWLFYYLFFVILGGVSIWRIYRIYRK